MKIRHNDIIVPEENPFENCKLDREVYADVLTDIVNGYEDGFVLAINNPWGEGKTTFIKMWEQKLKNDGYKTLYFNAWENDFQEDVLVALLAELEVLKDTKTEENYKKVLTKAAPLIQKAGIGLIKGLAKKAGVDEMIQAIIEGTAEATLKGLENEMESYANRKKGIQDFRETLESYVELISKDKPVVFVIDELDRCRPNYAVKVLEQVKHLFSVSGIVFVLSIDKEQLGHAVRGVYGSDYINADEYLRRFIDLEYSIPKPKSDKMIGHFYNFFQLGDVFEQRIQAQRVSFNDSNELLSLLEMILEGNNLSIRQMEKLFSHINLCLRTIDSRHFLYPRVLILMIYIKMFRPSIYKLIKEKKEGVQEMLNTVEGIFSDSLVDKNLKSTLMKNSVEFTFFYNNFYFEDSYPRKEVFTRGDTTYDYRMNFKSKFEDDEANKNLNAAFKEINQRGSIINKNLSDIIIKIELLNPLIQKYNYE